MNNKYAPQIDFFSEATGNFNQRKKMPTSGMNRKRSIVAFIPSFRKFRKRTTSRDLIIGLTLTISLVVTIMGSAYFAYSTEQLQQSLNERATYISEELAEVLSLPLWNLDYDTIEQTSQVYLKAEYLAGIQVRTDYDEIVFESLPPEKEKVICKSKDVVRGGSYVGRVELWFTLQGINQAQSKMIRTMAILVCSVIVVVILGTNLIMNFLLEKPMERLIQGIRAIADGNYQTPLFPVPQEDINTIIYEINVMAGHIDYRTRQLQREIIERRKAQKELSESEKKYRSIFENAAEGIFQVTPQGRFLTASPSLSQMLGYNSPEELICTVTDIESQLHVDADRRKELLCLFQKGDRVTNFECRLFRKDRSVIWVLIQARALRDNVGQLTCMEGFVQEITQRKQAQEALQNAYKDLERRVAERTVELRKANEELQKAKSVAEAATRARGEFLANMSHEIRTPMNGVISAADLALSENLSPKVAHYLKIIHSSAYSLLGLVNDILDFSKIEAGKLDLELRPFRLDEVLYWLTDVFNQKAAEKGIELLVDVNPQIPQALIGDSLRLQQILTNLLSNATKFTNRGGVIIQGVKAPLMPPDPAEPDRLKLEFFVKDTGIGMAPEFLERLFKPFRQADASTTRKFGGTGLGLSICKQLVEMMGGTIRAESKKGSGSTFTFTVPLRRQPVEQGPRLVLPPDIQDVNVLVVDASADSRNIMEKLLTSYGFQVESVTSAQNALGRLKKAQHLQKMFDLVMMDGKLPDLDSIETSRIIRQELKLSLPIILMTALGKEAEKADAEKIGINAFLIKPIYPSTLFNAVMDAFGKEVRGRVTTGKPITTEASIYKNRLKGSRILVAEDNPTNQEIAVAILEGAGIAVEIAGTGTQAVEMAGSKCFDAVLMDIQMPEMDGYEATRRIRKDPALFSLPIIAMTAHAMKGDEEKCLSAGMDGYVSKPINQNRLFQTLWKLIRRKQQPAAAEERKPLTLADEKTEDQMKESQALPTHLPGINIQVSLNRLGLDQDTFKRILAGFYKDNTETLNHIRDAFDGKKWETLRQLAHSLKGSAANIGAEALNKAAKDLEMASKTQTATPVMIDDVGTALNQVLDSLGTMAGAPAKAAPDEPI
jgi:PAS domain S-box-containing protein